jgi:fused signal recognition particle receptor
MALFEKLKKGLEKTRDQFSARTMDVIRLFSKTNDALFEELEEVLIMSDVGYETSSEITERLRQKAREENIQDADTLKSAFKEIITDIMEQNECFEIKSPVVILIIGVNGVGKTTTIGKLASLYKTQGKKVILAAADTFRAAAIEQLDEWSRRCGADIIKQQEGSDPASVVYNAALAFKSRKADILICDTAGRLHNKKNLMDELAKINKVIDRELPGVQKEVFLVLDATTGQNALSQAKSFAEAAPVTGIVLTKLDGTAKGGIVIAVKREQNIPVRYVGVGEGIDDLQPFSAKEYVDALFS